MSWRDDPGTWDWRDDRVMRLLHRELSARTDTGVVLVGEMAWVRDFEQCGDVWHLTTYVRVDS